VPSTASVVITVGRMTGALDTVPDEGIVAYATRREPRALGHAGGHDASSQARAAATRVRLLASS
jgi:hypothetical protein